MTFEFPTKRGIEIGLREIIPLGRIRSHLGIFHRHEGEAIMLSEFQS